ncbi:DUF411 domain-containing protein [Tropicimonas sediminicola]|uniref:Uncharacterized conserved protein n=1 Tax=Tropicimonas sediminicola TaxID=1031541 RepID=A0A239KQV8_9RHOB|nr:DUF411 domain-containing protein [Tropicimonas sediminicola]SNT20003.1 Uncharacterized conserved protein [Tropicimonas sediminicola]
MNRRHFMLATVGTALLARPSLAATPQLEVFKSPTCGCCSAWIAHMRQSGFETVASDIDDDALWLLKERTGITPELASCHTGFIDGYFIEGHVPAADVQRLLSERPEALGLTVPGMPIGSPGMEMGDTREPYDTLLVLKGGAAEVFQSHA